MAMNKSFLLVCLVQISFAGAFTSQRQLGRDASLLQLSLFRVLERRSSSSPSYRRTIVSATSDSAATSFASTPTPVYPVTRGSEVDARKIVAVSRGQQHIQAVLLAHVLFETEELAVASLYQLRSAQVNFDELARQISACTITRANGGKIGWVSMNQATAVNSSLALEDHEFSLVDTIISKQVRERVIQVSTKPGDIVMMQSPRGFHLVQIQDLMVDVRSLATFRKSKKSLLDSSRWQGLTVPPSDSSQSSDKTYKVETMGCQMNLNDSEVRYIFFFCSRNGSIIALHAIS
jgi:hypothetical protein